MSGAICIRITDADATRWLNSECSDIELIRAASYSYPKVGEASILFIGSVKGLEGVRDVRNAIRYHRATHILYRAEGPSVRIRAQKNRDVVMRRVNGDEIRVLERWNLATSQQPKQ